MLHYGERKIFELRLFFNHAAWDVTADTRAGYEAAARAAFERVLSLYCDRVERDARDLAFFEPTPEKRNPEHYRWLVGYQAYGWSVNAIADATGKDHAGVHRAIHHTARELGLTPRPAKNYDRSWTAIKIQAFLRNLL